jgi:hypothetical protein
MTEVMPTGAAEQILALARDAALLRQRVDELGQLTGECREQLAGVTDQAGQIADLGVLVGEHHEQLGGLEELAEQIAELQAAVEALQPDASKPPALWDWTAMNQQDALDAWETLGDWVAGLLGEQLDLVGSHDKRRRPLPPCWYQHRDVVWELSWLCQEWLGIYRGSGGNARQAGDWWDRYLPGALRRIYESSTVTGCNATKHVAPMPAAPAADSVAKWEAFVQEEIATRPPPPEPKSESAA